MNLKIAHDINNDLLVMLGWLIAEYEYTAFTNIRDEMICWLIKATECLKVITVGVIDQVIEELNDNRARIEKDTNV